MKLSLDELRRIASKALVHQGYDEREAGIILDVLLYAQLRGNNQGIVKLIGAGMPKDPEAGPIEIIRETKLSALLNGHKNPGIVVMVKAMELVKAKAKEHGFGLVGINNTGTSTGAIGYYAGKLAEAGLVAMVFAGSPPAVCAYGSYEPIFGTNPMAFGIPSQEEPLVFDMATAAMAWYGLVEAEAKGAALPGQVAYDCQGQLTTNPAEAMKGAILPFDRSHKGAGLSMMVEVLTGPLVAASFAGIGDVWGSWGNLLLAMDPELLVDANEFQENVSKLVARVKGTQRLPGVSEIRVPGERGDRLTQQHLASGEIEIEDGLYAALRKAAGES